MLTTHHHHRRRRRMASRGGTDGCYIVHLGLFFFWLGGFVRRRGEAGAAPFVVCSAELWKMGWMDVNMNYDLMVEEY